jgi:hypothetical protein
MAPSRRRTWRAVRAAVALLAMLPLVRRSRDGEVTLAPGTDLKWTGQYEPLEAMRERMKLLVPLSRAAG